MDREMWGGSPKSLSNQNGTGRQPVVASVVFPKALPCQRWGMHYLSLFSQCPSTPHRGYPGSDRYEILTSVYEKDE